MGLGIGYKRQRPSGNLEAPLPSFQFPIPNSQFPIRYIQTPRVGESIIHWFDSNSGGFKEELSLNISILRMVEYDSSSSSAATEQCIGNLAALLPQKKKKSKMKMKKRFNDEQIRSLETIFQSETKLEPRKKLQLAKELGLQPRQVAIWFQNKRARWKSKQLEKDYSLLRSNYNTLASQFQTLNYEKQSLLTQVIIPIHMLAFLSFIYYLFIYFWSTLYIYSCRN